MQLATGTAHSVSTANFAIPETGAAQDSRYAQYKVIRRNGAVVGFEPAKITVAMRPGTRSLIFLMKSAVDLVASFINLM